MEKFKTKKETKNDFENKNLEEDDILPQEENDSKNKNKFFLLGFFLVIIILAILFFFYYKDNKINLPSGLGEEQVLSENLQEELANQAKLQKFESYDEMKEFLSDLASLSFSSYRGVGGFDVANDLALPEAGVALQNSLSSKEEGNSGASEDYSQTNIQVQGVDEADIIKTDGEYIYAVAQKSLYISKAFPTDEAQVVSKIEFEDSPQDIFINGNKLIIFGNDSRVFPLGDESQPIDFLDGREDSIKADSPYVFFKVFDISDKKNPKQIRDFKFEGNYFNSRMIGDKVYFLTSKYAHYQDSEFLLPKILENGKELYGFSENSCKNCPPVYYSEVPLGGYNFINVAAVDLNEGNQKINNQIYLLPSSQNMYVSKDNIYITYTKHLDQSEIMLEISYDVIYPKLNDKDKKKTDKIMNADKDILTKGEKAEKIAMLFEKYEMSLSTENSKFLEEEIKDKLRQKMDWISKEVEKTVIHKISISKDELEYKGTGEVTGTTLNQFSMDEKDGYFRIATTRNRQWLGIFDIEKIENSQKSFNNLYVLDKDLKIVGSLERLAQDERIYSARFMQDRAYMVTFKQTDPLFVIDLKNPEDPKVLGQLKIPGFSNYLHPYNENILIGLGKETQENETSGFTTKGLKLSLFDVSDIENPKEIDKYVFEDNNTSSIAQNEHKAFLFSKEKNLLAFPISVDRPVFLNSIKDKISSSIIPGNFFRGAAVFHVDKNGFNLRGLISHSEGAGTSSDDYYGRNYYTNTIQRILYIQDVLYTFSNNQLGMNKIEDLSEIGKLDLEKKIDDYQVIN